MPEVIFHCATAAASVPYVVLHCATAAASVPYVVLHCATAAASVPYVIFHCARTTYLGSICHFSLRKNHLPRFHMSFFTTQERPTSVLYVIFHCASAVASVLYVIFHCARTTYLGSICHFSLRKNHLPRFHTSFFTTQEPPTSVPYVILHYARTTYLVEVGCGSTVPQSLASSPPSIRRSIPVTQDASLEAKNNAPWAMSSGVPNRPRG